MEILKEKQIEDIISEHPELIEEGLVLKGRQVSVFGRRMDLLFQDKHKRQLIVELKAGPIKDKHIGQILSYEGMLISADDPSIRVMLVGTRVPPNIRRALDHHGIAWQEIPHSALAPFLPEETREQLIDRNPGRRHVIETSAKTVKGGTNVVRSGVRRAAEQNVLSEQAKAVLNFLKSQKEATMVEIVDAMKKQGYTSKTYYDVCNGLVDAGVLNRSGDNPITFKVNSKAQIRSNASEKEGSFQFGEFYTRAQINEVLGGSVQSYLPTVKGRVVCACLNLKKNAEAPDVIYCGVKPRVITMGETLASQSEPLPIFLKKESNHWQFVGRYRVAKAAKDSATLKEYSARANRPLSQVVFMEKA